MLYFDNNATTLSPKSVCVEATRWVNIGNPSADHSGGKAARAMMEKFRRYLGDVYGISTCCPSRSEESSGDSARIDDVMSAATHVVFGVGSEDPSLYKVIFCSGGSEANATIIQSVVYSAKKYRGGTPHVIASQVEHKSVLAQLDILKSRGDADYTLVHVDLTGRVSPEDVAKAIREDTCLVCIMHANNETGTINPIREIAAVAHDANIPFHCDIVQTAGRIPPNFIDAGIDSASMSFHKFHGFAGAGALIIKQQLLMGHRLQALIPGTQNDGLRGGTENIVGIASGFAALKFSMQTPRSTQNAWTLARKHQIMSTLADAYPTRTYAEYVQDPAARNPSRTHPIEIVFISGIKNCLPNTILLSVVHRGSPKVCNKKIKEALAREKCIISVGSACNTASASASHVLYALGADEFIRAGALRISLGDSTTPGDCMRFCGLFFRIIREHLISSGITKK